jgi:DNA-binding NtrC family response regulator
VHFIRNENMKKPALRVLLADDDHSYSTLLEKTLVDRGYSVVVRNSGEEALTILKMEVFDIVLLDFKMEGTSGINVLQWMYGKKMEIPVILITSHGGDEIYEEAFKWGAMEYFVKGDRDTVRLPVLMEQVLNKFQARKERTK